MSAPPPLLPQIRYIYNQGKKPILRGLFFTHVGFATVIYAYWKIPVTRKLILGNFSFSTCTKLSKKTNIYPLIQTCTYACQRQKSRNADKK